MLIADIRKPFSYLRDLPQNFEDRDLPRFSPIRECQVSTATLSLVKNVKASQYYLFSGTSMLEDFCLPIQKRGQLNNWKQWAKLQLFPQMAVHEAIWVTDVWSRNYFHWILECLPRILVVRSLGISAPILVPEHIYSAPYVQDSLRDFGLGVITFNFRQSVKVGQLYLPSHDSPCAFDPTYLKSVVRAYETIDSPVSAPAKRRVFITRKDASKRKIINEEEMLPILMEAGFEIARMESLSFKQQRDLMRETTVLLSQHGAGLANLIFLPKGARVIELHPDVERYNSCFYHLAAALGVDYFYSFEEGDHSSPQEANIKVDIDNLRKLLTNSR